MCIRKRPKQETSNLLQYGISEEKGRIFASMKSSHVVFSFPVDHKFQLTSFQHWYKRRAFSTLIQVHQARSPIQRQIPPEKVLSRAIPSPGRALNY